ncbi:hypothetical protein HLRTI_000457 [Halorhabdus tiamatea SARL4B]|uniref:Uncharacterized protein n=1 Tax=Halorhabdus tiamatea SARL4B TaxID=1033806 RepID=F7PLM4_9EURY|nr:hypothetical protein [Halorhabdus tiamatea]ERJ07415.1 hypothetical protein HLRTI_000457 [Halorhabdus tiamatea SARL4B]
MFDEDGDNTKLLDGDIIIMTNTSNSESESSSRGPKLTDKHGPLRKVQYDGGTYFIYLGSHGEQSGLEQDDRVIPDVDEEEGSIVLLEDHHEADDARTLLGSNLRVTIPKSHLSLFGFDLSDYDQTTDSIVVALEPYPDEEGYPSAVEVFPLGYASNVLDEEDRLLPPEERTSGEEEAGSDLPPVSKTDTGREIYPIGIAPNIVDLVCDHYTLEFTDFYTTLEEIATLEDDFFSSDVPFSPIDASRRVVHYPTEGTWDDIVDKLEIPEEHVEASAFAHHREAQYVIAELSDFSLSNHADAIEATDPVVIPK